MKKITVEVQDETNATLKETVEVNHLSDLGEGVKDAVNDFVTLNGGVVIPPVSINVTQQTGSAEPAPRA